MIQLFYIDPLYYFILHIKLYFEYIYKHLRNFLHQFLFPENILTLLYDRIKNPFSLYLEYLIRFILNDYKDKRSVFVFTFLLLVNFRVLRNFHHLYFLFSNGVIQLSFGFFIFLHLYFLLILYLNFFVFITSYKAEIYFFP